MRPQLKFWSTKTKQEKQSIKDKHGIKVVTFKWIEKLYKESNKPPHFTAEVVIFRLFYCLSRILYYI